MHYFDYIAGATGISIHNMGVSGSGYAKGGSDNFMTRISNVPTDSDVVTIFGSGNDGSSGLSLGTASDTGTTTLGGVINTTIDNLYVIMPVVKLGIVTPTPWVNNMPLDEGFMESYSNLLVEICKRRSIPCLDLYHCSNLNPNSSQVRTIAYSNDEGNGVHPNELGHKLIASHFKSFLETLLM
jgi:lysophospholipase L1-like esterase